MRRLGNAATVLARIVPTLTRLWQGLYTAPFIEVDEALSPHKGTWPMKSERRHELQHNALADWLVKAGETTKPYQNIMLASIVLVVVALAAYSWMSRESSAQTTQAWDDLNTALDSGNPMELAQVRGIEQGGRVVPVGFEEESRAVVVATRHVRVGPGQRVQGDGGGFERSHAVL